MGSPDEEITVKLDSLEIAPTLQPLKLRNIQLPLALNPFFDATVKDTSSDAASKQNTTYIFTNARNGKCPKCRQRRRSESSILDDIRSTSTSSNNDHQTSAEKTLTLGRSINKNLKKVNPTNRKFFLRDPVLRALKTCIHSQNSARRKQQNNDDKDNTDAAVASTPVSATSSNFNITLANPCLRGMNDFRDLIVECETLLKEDVKLSNRFNHLRTVGENSKSFRTMQMPRNKVHPKNISPSNSINNTSSSIEQSQAAASNSAGGGGVNGVGSINYRSSTSCSQQAGNSSNCDDVTIDELASYFDTFVHIPKKMSTMAEMMYI